ELRARDGRWLKTLTPLSLGYRQFLHLDEGLGQVWVSGGAEPTETQLFRVPLGPTNDTIARVTREPGVYGGVFAKRHGAWVQSFNRLDGPPIKTVMDAGGAA